MPAARPTQPFHRRHVFRIATATAAVTFAAGYVASDLDGQAVDWLPRAGILIAAVLLIVCITEIRVSRQLARNEAHLALRLDRIERRLGAGPTRNEYWGIYSDVMADLGGVDGEPSGEIPRGPRR